MRYYISSPDDPTTEFPTAICRAVTMTDAGLVWGDGSVLIRMSKVDEGAPRLSLDADRDRFATLMSVAADQPAAPDALMHIEAADRFWQRGDKALANLRLIFADLREDSSISFKCASAAAIAREDRSRNSSIIKTME